MLDRKELEYRLHKARRPMVAAFAVRASLRVLPALAAGPKETLWFWKKEDRAGYLLALVRAQQAGILASIDDTAYATSADYKASAAAVAARASAVAARAAAVDTAYVTADAANATANSVAFAADAAACAANALRSACPYDPAYLVTSIADVAYDAAYAATSTSGAYDPVDDAISADFAEVTANASYASYAARAATIHAAAAVTGLDAILHKELEELRKRGDVVHYLSWPLWPLGMPDEFRSLWEDLVNAMRGLMAGFEYWVEWYEMRLRGDPIDLDRLEKSVFIPLEIESQGVVAINAYLAGLRSAEKPLNRVRTIFIGYGDAGKTSLIRALHKEEVTAGKEKWTPGIDIRVWPVPETEIQAHLWDFGGQVMMHATHRFFLRSNCLYVLVLDGRRDIETTAQAQYWLEHIKAFGGDSPVMIVGNKADVEEVHPDMGFLKEKYPNVTSFYSLSSTAYNKEEKYRQRFALFRTEFVEHLRGHRKITFTFHGCLST